jgi:hypothetical protein
MDSPVQSQVVATNIYHVMSWAGGVSHIPLEVGGDDQVHFDHAARNGLDLCRTHTHTYCRECMLKADRNNVSAVELLFI